MNDLQTIHPVVWTLAIIALGVLVTGLIVYARTKMDPRVKEMAGLAYKAAAEIAEIPARGSTPPVDLKDGPWEHRGVTVVGNYKWLGFFGKVFWDRILVIKDPARIWEVLLHEMMHAVRRRNGLPSNEAAAYATKILAAEKAPSNLAALLEEL